MTRLVGTEALGIRLPIIKEGDNLVDIVANSLIKVVNSRGIELKSTDIIGITESLLARAQGNYVSLDEVAEGFKQKYKSDEISVIHPILSRNRFLNVLKALSKTGKKIKVYLSYPNDEVGNPLMDKYKLMRTDIDVYKDTLTEEDYLDKLGEKYLHPFTGLDYVKLYESAFEEGQAQIFYSNNLDDIIKNSKAILVANVHDRENLVEIFSESDIEEVYTLGDILTEPINGSGYNSVYGLYGSNTASDNSLKLFPRNSMKFLRQVQARILELTGKTIEVLVFGDGAFKDPVGGIWEFADPVVAPAFSEGLSGRPNEVKIKYLADNEMADLSGEEAIKAIKAKILDKNSGDLSDNTKLGTTPRQITDLVGSLCDLMSGSGDKGTPVIYIRGYFDNYSSE